MVYGVVCEGVIECSNTLEDEEDAELLPQALVCKLCRQRIYGLLLQGHEGRTVNLLEVINTNTDTYALWQHFAHSAKHLSKHEVTKVDTYKFAEERP